MVTTEKLTIKVTQALNEVLPWHQLEGCFTTYLSSKNQTTLISFFIGLQIDYNRTMNWKSEVNSN